MFDLMVPTPARAAATGQIDRIAPRLSRTAAIAAVLVAYLLFSSAAVTCEPSR